MVIDPASPRTRRAVLVASVGGLAATIASALGRPELVRAGSDGDVVLGAANSTSGATSIASSVNNQNALTVTATGTIAGAIYGHSDEFTGVFGGSTSDVGVFGQSASSIGVYGNSDTGHAVFGWSGWDNGPAVVGQSAGGHSGVYGYSGEGTPPPAFLKAGVVGRADQDYSAIGVLGVSTSGYGVEGVSDSSIGVLAWSESGTAPALRANSPGNGTAVHGVSGYVAELTAPAKTGVFGYAVQDSGSRGVHGQSMTGRGVYGEATTGQGVRAFATTGAALYGSTSDPKSGVALRTVGKVRFDKSVGIATITSGTRSVTVTPGINLTSSAAVVATLQGNPGGTTTVQRVAVNAAADTFTIYLTANATANVKVAWHVFG